jgi:hypothetical protein
MRLPACPPRAIPLRMASSRSGVAAVLPQARSGRRKEEIVMLQVVHTKNGGPQASSVYCQWILVERGASKRLVAVWIDSAMSVFEKEFASSRGVVGSVAGKHSSAYASADVEKGEAGRHARESGDEKLQQSEDGLVAIRLLIEERPPKS